ncbi:MAG: PAS domain S-box protein [Candidatus Geothermincolia bacterium]
MRYPHPLKSLKLLLIAWFFLSIGALACIDVFYVLSRQNTASDFLFDVAVTTAAVIVLMVPFYLVARGMIRRWMQAEARLESIVDSLPDTIFELNDRGHLCYANRTATATFGYQEGELDDDHLWEILEESGTAREDMRQMIASRQEYVTREYTGVRKDGTTFPVLISASLDTDGTHIKGILGIIKDISERKTLEDELRKSRKLFQALVEHSGDVFTIVGSDGKVTYNSPSVEEVFGFTPEEMIGRFSADLVHPDDRDKIVQALAEALDHPGYKRKIEYRGFHKNGEVVTVEALGTSLTDDPDVQGIVMSVRDVTDRKKTEEELRSMNVELESYARMVSHDLQAPLSAAVLNAQALLKTAKRLPEVEPREELEEMAGIILDAVSDSVRLTKDLLALAEAGYRPSRTSMVDIGDIVARVVSDHAGEIEERGVRIKVSGTLGQVRSSPTQMYQLFSNVIGNAIRYGSARRPVVVIKCTFDEPGRSHGYLVRDNGPGVREGDEEAIFQPFFKGQEGGHGIGLATAARIVAVHGGGIRAYNNGGACFEFHIDDLDDFVTGGARGRQSQGEVQYGACEAEQAASVGDSGRG